MPITLLKPKRVGLVAFAKQAAIGTPAANPTFALPIKDDSLEFVEDRAELGISTGGNLSDPGDYIQRRSFGGGVEFLAYSAASGLLLFEAMGGQAVAGAGDPYTHTFTLADTLPLPLTMWMLDNDQWWLASDVWVTKLMVKCQSGENATIGIEVLGGDYEPTTAPAYSLVLPTEPRMKFIGGTMKAEADSAVPATLTNVTGFELTVDRQMEPYYGASILPTMVTRELAIDFSMGMVYDATQQGWDFLKASAMGSVAGTNPSQDIPAGSFDVTLAEHPANPAHSLRIYNNSTNWQYGTTRPGIDPGNGGIEFDVAGKVIRPASGSDITIVLINGTAGTY